MRINRIAGLIGFVVSPFLPATSRKPIPVNRRAIGPEKHARHR